MGIISTEFPIARMTAKMVEVASRKALSSSQTARQEAQKISFAVSDVVALSFLMQGKQLYGLLLPATAGRLRVAPDLLASPTKQSDLRDVVAFPLQSVLDPVISNRPWYDRLQIARNIAQLDSRLIEGYMQYEMGQENAKRRDLNVARRDFIDSFLTDGSDTPILQQRLREIQYSSVTPQPLDFWILQELQMLRRLPIADLRLIADHPKGGELLKLYQQFDVLFSQQQRYEQWI